MDDITAIFIVIMFAMALFAYLTAMWIKYRRPTAAPETGQSAQQIDALRNENRQLQQRIAVLERIATDPAERTAREIEELRS